MPRKPKKHAANKINQTEIELVDNMVSQTDKNIIDQKHHFENEIEHLKSKNSLLEDKLAETCEQLAYHIKKNKRPSHLETIKTAVFHSAIVISAILITKFITNNK